MNVSLHLFIPPIGEFDAGSVNGAMPLVGVGDAVYVIGYDDRLAAIKGAAVALSRTKEIVKFGD